MIPKRSIGAAKGGSLGEPCLPSKVCTVNSGKFRTVSKWFYALFVLLSGVGSIHGQAHKAVKSVPVNVQVQAPHQILKAGESVQVLVSLVAPPQKIVEYNLDLEISPLASCGSQKELLAPGGAVAFSTQGSRLQAMGAFYSPTLKSGALFQLTLTATEDNVDASSLVSGGGTVLIVIEDVGF